MISNYFLLKQLYFKRKIAIYWCAQARAPHVNLLSDIEIKFGNSAIKTVLDSDVWCAQTAVVTEWRYRGVRVCSVTW